MDVADVTVPAAESMRARRHAGGRGFRMWASAAAAGSPSGPVGQHPVTADRPSRTGGPTRAWDGAAEVDGTRESALDASSGLPHTRCRPRSATSQMSGIRAGRHLRGQQAGACAVHSTRPTLRARRATAPARTRVTQQRETGSWPRLKSSSPAGRTGSAAPRAGRRRCYCRGRWVAVSR